VQFQIKVAISQISLTDSTLSALSSFRGHLQIIYLVKKTS